MSRNNKRSVIGDCVVDETKDKIKIRDIFTNHVISVERKKK